MKNIYEFSVKDNLGEDVSLKKYQGKTLLIINSATKCGLTPQYAGLQALYEKYQEKGFEILDFPCNQFLEQAPEDNQGIQQFCETHYGTTFPRFSKIDVNGSQAIPLYQYLKETIPNDDGGAAFKEFLLKLASLGQKREGSDIKWNFTKFLINKEGIPVARFAPSMKPEEIEAKIQEII